MPFAVPFGSPKLPSSVLLNGSKFDMLNRLKTSTIGSMRKRSLNLNTFENRTSVSMTESLFTCRGGAAATEVKVAPSATSCAWVNNPACTST